MLLQISERDSRRTSTIASMQRERQPTGLQTRGEQHMSEKEEHQTQLQAHPLSPNQLRFIVQERERNRKGRKEGEREREECADMHANQSSFEIHDACLLEIVFNPKRRRFAPQT